MQILVVILRKLVMTILVMLQLAIIQSHLSHSSTFLDISGSLSVDLLYANVLNGLPLINTLKLISSLFSGQSVAVSKKKKKRINSDDDLCVNKKKRKDNFRVVKVPQINGAIVLKLCIHREEIYIGGSNGILLRHTANGTHKYDTNTMDDIRHVEIMVFRDRTSLVAITKKTIMIYEDHVGNYGQMALITDPQMEYVRHKYIDLTDISGIYRDSSILYLSLTNGMIKRLHNHNLEISDHATHCHGHMRYFVPGQWNSVYALASLVVTVLHISPRLSCASSSRTVHCSRQ